MLSRSHAAPPCHAKRYTRFVGPPLAHTVSRQSRPVRARPSHAAGNGTRHTTRARTGSMRIRLLSPYPSLVTMTDPSERVARFKGSVPTATARPAGRIRQPEGSSVDPSGNDPGTRRVARSAAPAMAGSARRERLSMNRNMAARGTGGERSQGLAASGGADRSAATSADADGVEEAYVADLGGVLRERSEEHTSELQSRELISY